MEAATHSHPTDEALRDYGLGKLDGPAELNVEGHLEQCPECRQRLAAVSSDSFLGRLRASQKAAGRTSAGEPAIDATISLGAVHPAPPPSAESLPPGLAAHPDYQIKRELGRGGMGVVYLAYNGLTGRDEVLKVIGRHIVERPGAVDRFMREIRAVAGLRHPNIVAGYSAARLGDSIVLAMEYVEGHDLARVVKAKGPLPVPHASYFAHQTALALQHAHEEGMVHRDIKPANLMLSRRGSKAIIKVLDFGLAKIAREELVDGGLTSEGQSLGTPDFIAPEQIRDAQKADIRADIYSLGGTLYYLLTGRPPFEAKTLYDIYQAHISRDADPLNFVRPEVPAELAALVAKMMAKDPARRFQTPAEVAEALRPFFQKTVEKPVSEVSTTGNDVGTPSRPSVETPAPPQKVGPDRDDKRHDEVTVIPTDRRRFSRLANGAIASGILAASLICAWAAGILRLKTQSGVLVIENVPEDASLFIDGDRITARWPGGGAPLEVSVPQGNHGVIVKKDAFTTFGDVVTVEANGRQSIRVSLVPVSRIATSVALVGDAEKVATVTPPPAPPASSQPTPVQVGASAPVSETKSV